MLIASSFDDHSSSFAIITFWNIFYWKSWEALDQFMKTEWFNWQEACVVTFSSVKPSKRSVGWAKVMCRLGWKLPIAFLFSSPFPLVPCAWTKRNGKTKILQKHEYLVIGTNFHRVRNLQIYLWMIELKKKCHTLSFLRPQIWVIIIL